MKLSDMLRMSLSSLFKRKVRTILTVLGVVIGTASIVVMISLGLGMKRASLEEIEQYGGLTSITVMEKDAFEMETSQDGSGSKKKTVQHLDDKVLEEIMQVEHVEYAYPVLEAEVLILCGSYQCFGQIRGIPAESMEYLKLNLGEGSLPDPDSEELSLVFGNGIVADFYNEKTGQSYWSDGKLPDIDLMESPLMYVLDTDSYYNFAWGTQDDTTTTMPKKYMFSTSGVLAGGVEDYNSNAYLICCDLDCLKKVLKKEFRNRAIPGQPTTASGKPMKEIYYNTIMVGVDDMDHVKEVQNTLSQMGYSAESNAEWVESMQGQFQTIQLALGGIGAVSLLVAAIGIANTMMMSIYERTKEIGIMKVLGCDMKNIQGMFLLEAGYIGLIGGLIGVGISYGLSAAVNALLTNGSEMGIDLSSGSGISYIPGWLSLLAICFAVVVGMAAGFFPSLRAMRLSPLAAIRNE